MIADQFIQLSLFKACRFARLLKSILLILFFTRLVYSYIANTYEIKDLETNDERFKSEIQAWSTSPLWHSDRYTLCGGFYILGGAYVLYGTGQTAPENHYFMRTYYNLPSHSRVYFSFQLWMIDTWDSGDIVEIKLDSKVFNGWVFEYETFKTMVSNQCGNTHVDIGCIKVSGSASHADSSLTFAVISKADSPTFDESLGIRDVVLNFAKTSALTSDIICGNAGINLDTQQCPCPDRNYQNGPTCSGCHDSCASCFGPSANECYRCNEGYSFDGIGCLACGDNCATCDSTNPNKCMSCKSGYVLLDNSKCILEASCSSPLVLFYSNRVCMSNCSDQSYLLSWNGTCAGSCPSYYRPRVSESRKFCDLRCPLEKFFYIEDNMCLEICPLGFFASDITKLCLKCEIPHCRVCPSINKCSECVNEAILDTDDTCRLCKELKITYLKSLSNGHRYRLQLLPPTCELDQSVLENHLEGLINSLSNFPPLYFIITKHKNNFYQLDLILSGSVLEKKSLDIEFFHLNGTIEVAKKFIPSSGVEKASQNVGLARITLASFMGATMGGTLLIKATTVVWSLLGFQQFVGYFVYINVEYPPQVMAFLSLFQDSTWDFLPNPLIPLTSKWSKDILNTEDPTLEKYSPPQKFLDNEVTSFFVENAGSIIFLNLGLFLILGFLMWLEKVESWKEKRILKIIIKKLKWNVIIRIYLEDGIQLSLGIFLQLRSFSFEHFYLAICTVLALLSLTFLIIMALCIVRIMRKHKKTHLKEQGIQELYGTLYKGMDLTEGAGRYYHIIILFRGIVLILLVTYFENYPLLQTSILIYMNAGLVYFLFDKARFLDRKLNTINRIKEIFVLVAEICILFLQFQTESIEYYDVCGWIIVGSLGLSLFIETAYAFMLQFMHIKTIINKLLEYYICIVDFIKGSFKKKTIKSHDVRSREGLSEVNNDLSNLNNSRVEVSEVKASSTKEKDVKNEGFVESIMTFGK